MKYFVLGALASGMLLYGMSMIYGATGGPPRHPADRGGCQPHRRRARPTMTLVVFGLVFIVAGLGFKLGAVPFHMWVPDVYQGAPTAVTILIGSAPKLAAFALVLRILAEALGGAAVLGQWQAMLAILAILSMAIGNVTAIAQTNFKRMLGYSAIAHMGFLLLGFLAGTPQRLQLGDVLCGGLRADEPGRLRDDPVALARRLRGREPRRLQGPQPARPLACVPA